MIGCDKNIYVFFSMKRIIYISIALMVVGCAASKSLTPTQGDVDRVSSEFAGYTLADLEQGKKLYEENCGLCHKLYKPSRENEQGWNNIVPEMVKKTNRKQAKEAVTPEGEELIRKYLITMSGK